MTGLKIRVIRIHEHMFSLKFYFYFPNYWLYIKRYTEISFQSSVRTNQWIRDNLFFLFKKTLQIDTQLQLTYKRIRKEYCYNKIESITMAYSSLFSPNFTPFPLQDQLTISYLITLTFLLHLFNTAITGENFHFHLWLRFLTSQ